MDPVLMVCGFAIDPVGRVLLIRKQKPEWQKGFLNGVGGKMEPGEIDPHKTMRREWDEEVNADKNLPPVQVEDWRGFCMISVPEKNVTVFFFVGSLSMEAMSSRHRALTDTGEMLQVVNVRDLPFVSCLPNLRWMIPLALDKEMDDTNVPLLYMKATRA